MPTHAKILAGLLAFNVLIGLYPLTIAADGGAIFGLVIRVLLLLGFLKGSEGVRTLLLIGAGLSVIIGAVGLLLAIPTMSVSGALGMVVVVTSAYSVVVGIYMWWALKNAEVQQWMFKRSVGGSLDD